MLDVTIKVDAIERAIAEYARKLVQEAGPNTLKTGADAAEVSAKATIRATTQRHTGELEDSWSQSWRGPNVLGLMNYSDHAEFIDKGTPPHRIEAKRAKVLAFQFAGGMMFRRAVNHPGTKARPFVALAMAAGQMAMKAKAQAETDRLAHQF